MIVVCALCWREFHESNAAYAFPNSKSHCCAVSYVCEKCYNDPTKEFEE